MKTLVQYDPNFAKHAGEYSGISEAVQFVKSGPSRPMQDEFPHTSEKMVETALAILARSAKHADLLEFEQKSLKKWWGPQGYSQSWSFREADFEGYYQEANPHCFTSFHPMTRELLKPYMQGACNVLTPQALFAAWKPDSKSNSGIHTWSDRRQYPVRVHAIRYACLNPTTADPQVVGQKNERNKCRNIFMDTFENQLRGMRLFKWAHDALVPAQFVAWRGDAHVEREYYEFAHKRVERVLHVEGDYEHMDYWVRFEHALTVYTELGLLAGAPNYWFEEVFEFLQNLFNSECLTPRGWAQGEHSLFSGQYITNDVESFINIDAQVRLVYDHLVWKKPPVFGKDYWFVVLGDDSLLVLDMTNLVTSAEEIPEIFAAMSMQHYGIVANASKQRVCRTNGWFCKRNFAAMHRSAADGYTHSIYPIVLAINSIFHPRNGQVPTFDNAYDMVTAATKLDNCQHHPAYSPIRDMVFKLFDLSTISSPEEFIEACEHYNSKKEWRVRLYGQRLTIDSSPTLKWWFARMLDKSSVRQTNHQLAQMADYILRNR